MSRLQTNPPRNEDAGASWAPAGADAVGLESGAHQLDRARCAGTSNAGYCLRFWRLGQALRELSYGGGRREPHLVPLGTALAARPLVFE